MAIGAPAFCTAYILPFHADTKSTSLSVKSWAGWAPAVHHTFTWGLILSRLRKARSISRGYNLSNGTPSAMRANSRLLKGSFWRERDPGKLETSQKSFQLPGCFPFGYLS